MSKKKDTKRTEQIQEKAKKKLSQIKQNNDRSSYSYSIHVDPKTGKPTISNSNKSNVSNLPPRDPRKDLMREAYQRAEQYINKTHKNCDIMYNLKNNQYRLVEVDSAKAYKSARAKADKKHDVLLFDFGYIFLIVKQALAHYDFYTYKHMASIIALNMQSHPSNLTDLSNVIANYTRTLYKSSPERFEKVIMDLNTKMQYEICKAHIQYVHDHQRHNADSVYRTLSNVSTDYSAHYYPIWPHKLADASNKAVRARAKGLQVLDEVYHYVLDDEASMRKAIYREATRLLDSQARSNKIQTKISINLSHLDNDISSKNASASKEDFSRLMDIMNRYPTFMTDISKKIIVVHSSFKEEDMTKKQDMQFRTFLYNEMIKAMQAIYDDHDLYEANENLRTWVQNTKAFVYKHVFNNLNPRFPLPARSIDEASKDISRLIQYAQTHKTALVNAIKLNYYNNK